MPADLIADPTSHQGRAEITPDNERRSAGTA